jgi:hypothetical protein
MIASAKVGTYYSRITLALLASTGWYDTVSFNFTEPGIWGKGRGCGFLDVDNCTGKEFCESKGFDCQFEVAAMGSCGVDPFAGACKVVNYFLNTICID